MTQSTMTASQFALRKHGTINFDYLSEDGWGVKGILNNARRGRRVFTTSQNGMHGLGRRTKLELFFIVIRVHGGERAHVDGHGFQIDTDA
jgi:hypothetical protein